jgi:hypothetical protein
MIIEDEEGPIGETSSVIDFEIKRSEPRHLVLSLNDMKKEAELTKLSRMSA